MPSATKLHPFDKTDFDAFAGVESENPEIAWANGMVGDEKASAAVILDGARVAVEMNAWDTEGSTSFQATFPTVAIAKDAAETLAGRTLITSDAMGELGFTQIR